MSKVCKTGDINTTGDIISTFGDIIISTARDML